MQEHLRFVFILSRYYVMSHCHVLRLGYSKNGCMVVYDDWLDAIISELRMKDGANYAV
jgi:hypothetical protein